MRTKRAVDFVFASVALVVCLPLLAITSLTIRLTMGAPVLFKQVRPGYKGQPFELLKFRTMRAPHDGEVWFRSDDVRLTRAGRVLRKLSLDELPSLWNVWSGDMSLVGPRPLLMEYLPKYTPTEQLRHDVPPGVTGWAQVNGRQSIPFSRRLELDVWYAANRSLTLDFHILASTAFNGFAGKGVHSGQAVDDVDDIGLSSDLPRRSHPREGGTP